MFMLVYRYFLFCNLFIFFNYNFSANTLQYLNTWLTYLIESDLIIWQKRNNNTYKILLGMTYFKKEKENTQYTTYNNLLTRTFCYTMDGVTDALHTRENNYIKRCLF